MRLSRAVPLFAVVLVLIALGARLLAPQEVTDPEGARSTTLVLPPPVPPAARVTAVLPRRAPVRARTGDVVVLAVRGIGRPDVLEVDRLGHEAHLGPGVANRLAFVADRPGRFELSTGEAGLRLGVLIVRPR